ncbi:hypothetical protein [Sphingomonas soli]|uniref:hypothetical protein n=1 Tax=Sphingomonas soli TaxID=266127 RepID=UPI00082D4CBA|nr:hypothetical protein [Sphingomonas soli]
MIGRLILTAAALVLAPAAAAQNADKPIAEVAADLAYGYCPLYLSGQFAITGNPVLKGFGFSEAVETREHPRGEINIVAAERSDGELGFGGIKDSICQVIVMGAGRAAAWDMLHKNMALAGFDFKPDPANTGPKNGATLETYKAPVEDQFIYLQLVEADAGPSPMVMAQIFVMEE